jgi:predicted AAA+ superfamily ATPase
MRYLAPFLRADLREKPVLLSGPRQVGKSTLAKGLLDGAGVYLNWDIRSHKRLIREAAWPKDSSLVVLDELHKLPKWKNFLKGIIDEFSNRPPLLVTGSARLEVLRRGGDPLTGRTYHYRLHPIDLAEAREFTPRLSGEEKLRRLLDTGGFPEAYLKPREALRLRNDRLDLVLREDLRDLSRTSAIQAIDLLVELLRERVASRISYSNLAEDLSVSMPTVKSWVRLLEVLYLVFLVTPYSRGLARGLKKEPKVYFFDCAAAYDEKGARLENLVACALLKHCHLAHDAAGRDLRLHYFRDREGREVDFVVTEARKVLWLVEVKSDDAALHPPLAYLAERLRPAEAVQLVRSLDRPRELRGIKILPLAEWLEALPSRAGRSP